MINANELRIGNWYELTGHENKYGVRLMYGYHFFLEIPKMNPGDTLSYYNIDPIPLDEEVLYKCGFEKVNNKNQHFFINDPNGYKDLYKIHIFPTLNEQWHIAFSDILSGKEISYTPTARIKHVHQLQNLYFALTGTEINLKP